MLPHDNVTADPLIAKLAGFSPAVADIDRAAILFQAGKASVRPRRLWPALTALLATTQAGTLALWALLPLAPLPDRLARKSAPEPVAAKVVDRAPVADPGPRDLLTPTGPALLRPAAQLVAPEPPLTVVAAYRVDGAISPGWGES